MTWHGNCARALVWVSAVVFAGCGNKNSGTTLTGQTDNVGNVVNLYIWSDYVAPNTLSDFEKDTGIKVSTIT